MTSPAALSKQVNDLRGFLSAAEYDPAVLDVVLSILASDPRDGLLVVWNELWPAAADWAPRVASFAMARSAERAQSALWPVASSFLASPSATDASTLINTITALQLAEPSPLARAVLRVDLEAFLLRCLASEQVVVDASVDLIVRLHDLDYLSDVLTQDQADRVLGTVEQLSLPPQRLQVVRECLNKKAFKSVLQFDQGLILRTADEFDDVAGASIWAAALFAARGAARAALRDLPSGWALAQDGQSVGMLQQLRFTGTIADAGRIALQVLEGVLRGWHRIFQQTYTSIARSSSASEQASVAIPQILAVAPQAGSFILKLIVEHTADDDVLLPAFEESVRLIEGRPTQNRIERDAELISAVGQLHGALKLDEINLTIEMSDRALAIPRARARISRQITQRILNATRPTTTGASEQKIVGILDGANFRTGTVQIDPVGGGGVLHCSTASSARPLLVNKVIGRHYAFTLNRTAARRERGDEELKWSLLAIEALDPAVGEQVVGVPAGWQVTDAVSSDHIPQQDNLQRIRQLVMLMCNGVAVTPHSMGMKEGTKQERNNSERHIDYMKHGAKVLGLISETGSLLPPGATVGVLSSEKALRFMAFQFQASIIGRAWLNWAKVSDIDDLDPDTAFDFLRERGVRGAGPEQGKPLSDSMIKRRGRTLRRWVRDFKDLPNESAEHVDDAES